jgi:predicted alpha-1,2-mannosidase
MRKARSLETKYFPTNAFIWILASFLGGCFYDQAKKIPATEPTLAREWVDTRSGTGGFWWASGHTSPAAQFPLGWVRIGPDTSTFSKIMSSSGYSYNDLELAGFSHLRYSGTGAYEGGVYRVKPVTGASSFQEAKKKKLFLNHRKEIASPGFYSAELDNIKVLAEFAPTKRGAIHRYTIRQSRNFKILVNLSSHLWGSGRVSEISVGEQSATEFVVSSKHNDAFSSRITGGLPLYGVFGLSKNPEKVLIHGSDFSDQQISAVGFPSSDPDLWLEFDFGNVSAGEVIELRVALSSVDQMGAQANFTAEIQSSDFDTVKSAAENAWEAVLGRITLTTQNSTEKKKFYENLYRSYVMPSVFSDSDGRYRNSLGNVDTFTGEFYGDLSLWDTFRTQTGLFCLLDPALQAKVANSILDVFQKTLRLPRWTVTSFHADSMIGFPSVMVLSETLLNNVTGVDAANVFGSVRDSLRVDSAGGLTGRECLKEFQELGYCSADTLQSVSLTHEYSYAYASAKLLVEKIIAERVALAPALSESDLVEWKENYSRWMQGSLKLWSQEYQSFVPKFSDGRALEPISLTDTDYLKLFASSEHVREGSLRQWMWYPAILGGRFFDLFGSQEKFVESLDNFFALAPDSLGALYPGSGFWQGNEPNMLAPFLYSLWGRPDLTGERARWVRQEKYSIGARALDGDDDAGTLSAYYVLSAMGIFPLAGTHLWIVGSPQFDFMRIQIRDSSAELRIYADGVESGQRHVQSVTLNGQSLPNPYFNFSMIESGGEIRFQMGDSGVAWGERWEN